ncbi:BgTH12-05972 [Blumeria graminis f. sp. triticale]|uniref:Bgt-1893 n=3 Tax=Blumeria graminis TaxID=34373 RepID=A0A381LIB0_BLUGR|nr:Heat shock protein [Blumeria graminis f. sp. tritici 96224]CAD6504239.1 BgTH12-05972 [Blumeria graminis f. sp. triticale]VDB91055.1 Bgt-1893 [Blumeria graminis f. sp. tritici]
MGAFIRTRPTLRDALNLQRIITGPPSRTVSPFIFRKSLRLQNSHSLLSHFHLTARHRINNDNSTSLPRKSNHCEDSSTTPSSPRPEYELIFTCKECEARSTHRISKQGYHHGSVLATCPGCKNRHVISDHLRIFTDKDLTIEDIMREQGQRVKKGILSDDGTVEVWSDGDPRADT